MPGVYVTVRN